MPAPRPPSSGASRPPGRLATRALWSLLIVLFVLGGAYGALGFAVGLALERALVHAGFPDAHVGHVWVGWNEARIDDLLLGAGGRNRAGEVQVAFTPAGLMAGRVARVRLDDVHVELRPFGPGPLSPGWLPTAGPSRAEVPVLPVDDIRVGAVGMTVVTPVGPMRLTTPGLNVVARDGRAAIDGPLRIEHDGMIADGRLSIQAEGTGGSARLDLVQLTLADSHWSIAGFSGAATADLHDGVVTAQAGIQGKLEGAGQTGAFAVDLAHGTDSETAAFDLHWGAARLKGTARAVITQGQPVDLTGTATVASFDPALFGGPAGRIDAKIDTRGTVANRKAALRVTARGSAALPGRIQIARATFNGPMDVAVSSGEIAVTLPDCARGDAGDVTIGAVRLPRIAIGCLRSADSAPLFALISMAVGPPSLTSQGALDEVGLDWQRAPEAASQPFKLDAVRWNLTRQSGTLSGEVKGKLRDGATPPWFAPMTLTTALRGNGPDHLKATIVGSQAANLRALNASVEIGPKGSGRADIRLGPFTIAPGDNWLEHTAPKVQGIRVMAGDLDLQASAAWDRKGLHSSGRLSVHRGVIETANATVSGLDTVLEATSLWPPVMPAGQRIAATALDAGLPLRNLVLMFGLPAGGPVAISEARAEWAGGALTARPFTVSLSVRRSETVLSVSNLDVGQILGMAKIAGLTGTGSVSGHIPLRLENDKLIVQDGRLEAHDGTIAYDPANPPAALSQGQAALALQAMRNFHYESLTLSLDGTSGGESHAILSLRGRNPTFYDGKAVQFTLNLSGALDTILSRGMAAYHLPGRVRAHIEGLEHKP